MSWQLFVIFIPVTKAMNNAEKLSIQAVGISVQIMLHTELFLTMGNNYRFPFPLHPQCQLLRMMALFLIGG